MRILNEDGVLALYGALVRQAVEDMRMGYRSTTKPCPRAFLQAAGFMDDAGNLDPRFITPKSVVGRPSHRKPLV